MPCNKKNVLVQGRLQDLRWGGGARFISEHIQEPKDAAQAKIIIVRGHFEINFIKLF